MHDFNCPYCSFGIDREDIDVHEDEHIGEWDVTCPKCKKVFELEAEASIDYWATTKDQPNDPI